MRIVFMGTPQFAVPSLELLIKENFSVVGVFTQPDRPKGRGQETQPPAVKEAAQAAGIPVFQPKKLTDPEVMEKLIEWAPDIIIVVAYGKLLPEKILDLPLLGCINIHASLLPRYRGAAPIQWAIINGETQTGVTVMQMSKELDAGDIISIKKTDIAPGETAGQLHDRLSILGANLLVETLPDIESDMAQQLIQDDSQASFAPMLQKESGRLDWKKPAPELVNLIRGLSPWPGAYTICKGATIKVHRARCGYQSEAPPGTVSSIESGEGIYVACGDGNTLCLQTVQREGKRPLESDDFLRGFPLLAGDFFE